MVKHGTDVNVKLQTDFRSVDAHLLWNEAPEKWSDFTDSVETFDSLDDDEKKALREIVVSSLEIMKQNVDEWLYSSIKPNMSLHDVGDSMEVRFSFLISDIAAVRDAIRLGLEDDNARLIKELEAGFNDI